MRRSWLTTLARALAAAGMLTGAAWAADAGSYGRPSADRPLNVEQRIAELEAELNRTQAAIASQNAELRRHEGVLSRLPAVDAGTPAVPTAFGAANAADTAAADDGQMKLSEGVVVGSDLNFKARWNNGLVFETPNKDFTMHIGGRFFYDWAFFDPDASLQLPPANGGFGPWQDGAFIRRLRFQMDGKMWSVFDYNVELDWGGNGQASTQDTFNRASVTREMILQDVWMQASELPAVGHFRVGHLKEAMGLENYQSSKYLTFIERGALQDAFLQEYDPGFLLWDNRLEDRLWWGSGFYRIDAEETGVDFGDGEYAWSSRVCYLLWDNPEHRYLMHIGGSYAIRSAEFDPTTNDKVVRFRARPEIRQTPRLVDTGNINCADVNLYGAELAWVHGPLSVQAEYLLTHIDDGVLVPSNVALGNVDCHGYYVFVSYFLTGENRPYDTSVAGFGRVKPYENFWLVRTADGNCFGHGAWELAARFSNVDLSNANGGNMDQVTLGVNWYWNPNMRLMFDYVWTDREISLPQQSGEVSSFVMQASLDF